MQLTGLNAGAGGMFSAPSSDPLLLALIGGWESVSWKGRNPLARQIELFWKLFLISGSFCLSASEYASSSIICVGNMQTISSLSLKTGLQSIRNVCHVDISSWATSYKSYKENVVWKGNGFWAISLNFSIYIRVSILIEDRQHEKYLNSTSYINTILA